MSSRLPSDPDLREPVRQAVNGIFWNTGLRKERRVPFTVKKRGKLTYYFKGERPVLSSLVTEELPDGDLKISFAGLTGGYSAKNVLGL